jgi:hypothetical protein
MNNFTIFNVITTKFLDQVTFIQNSMFYTNLFGNHVHKSISQPKQKVGAKTSKGEFFTFFQNKLQKPTLKLFARFHHTGSPLIRCNFATLDFSCFVFKK